MACAIHHAWFTTKTGQLGLAVHEIFPGGYVKKIILIAIMTLFLPFISCFGGGDSSSGNNDGKDTDKPAKWGTAIWGTHKWNP
jgi:hypothetical protein